MAKIRKTKGAWRTSKTSEYGVTKKEFHALIEKASHPIKREAESDSEGKQ
jgi:hypothetical protein